MIVKVSSEEIKALHGGVWRCGGVGWAGGDFHRLQFESCCTNVVSEGCLWKRRSELFAPQFLCLLSLWTDSTLQLNWENFIRSSALELCNFEVFFWLIFFPRKEKKGKITIFGSGLLEFCYRGGGGGGPPWATL